MRNARLLFVFIIFLASFTVIINLPGRLLPSNTPFLGSLSFKQGLDLQGGVSLTFKAESKNLSGENLDKALDSTLSKIERRVNFSGVSEPIIQKSKVGNENRIIVELPGVTDVDKAIEEIGRTASLAFWEEGEASSSGYPLGLDQILKNPKQTNLTGSDLSSTSVVFDQTSGKPQIQLKFKSEGVKKFADITKRNVGKPVAIVLDKEILSAPVVNEPILSGDAVISGEFTQEYANQLSRLLNEGALPLSLSVLEQHVVGPTLGIESLRKSLFAGILGFITIVIFMIVIYGRRGLIASVALVLYTLFTLSMFKLSSITPFAITLTLAGIAAFILSIGMAVDANILIFERIKEEIKRGREIGSATEVGFQRAWTSIRDSNVASLITAFILYHFGTGPVRGFALVLAIGVLVSMFSAITVTRTLLRVFLKH